MYETDSKTEYHSWEGETASESLIHRDITSLEKCALKIDYRVNLCMIDLQ